VYAPAGDSAEARHDVDRRSAIVPGRRWPGAIAHSGCPPSLLPGLSPRAAPWAEFQTVCEFRQETL